MVTSITCLVEIIMTEFYKKNAECHWAKILIECATGEDSLHMFILLPQIHHGMNLRCQYEVKLKTSYFSHNQLFVARFKLRSIETFFA